MGDGGAQFGIEIKVRIGDAAKLEALVAHEAKFLTEEYQKDEYFTPAHRDFLAEKPVSEWLRLRQSKTNSITYKNWHYEADGKTSHYCYEYESQVEDLEQLRKIFQALNFKAIVTVEKNRKSWRYEDYEISLDRVTGLGDFVEIEYKGHTNQTPKQITDDMVSFSKDLGCGKIERSLVGYPFGLLYPDEPAFEEI